MKSLYVINSENNTFKEYIVKHKHFNKEIPLVYGGKKLDFAKIHKLFIGLENDLDSLVEYTRVIQKKRWPIKDDADKLEELRNEVLQVHAKYEYQNKYYLKEINELKSTGFNVYDLGLILFRYDACVQFLYEEITDEQTAYDVMQKLESAEE